MSILTWSRSKHLHRVGRRGDCLATPTRFVEGELVLGGALGGVEFARNLANLAEQQDKQQTLVDPVASRAQRSVCDGHSRAAVAAAQPSQDGNGCWDKLVVVVAALEAVLLQQLDHGTLGTLRTLLALVCERGERASSTTGRVPAA
jgi:hypothetical protein